MRRHLLTALMLVALLLMPARLTAQDQPAVSLESSSGDPLAQVSLELEPGDAERIPFRVNGDASVRLSAVTSPPNGGIVLDDDPTESDVLSWLSLDGNASGDRTLSVAVPSDAEPGQYLAAIVAEGASADSPSNGSVPRVPQVVALVTVTVPGEMTAGVALDDPLVTTQGAARLVVPIRNTGSIPLALSGDLTLEGEGDTVTIPLTMGVVLPGVTTSIDLPLPPEVTPGEYTLSLTVADAASRQRASLVDVAIAVPATEGDTGEEAPAPAPVTVRNIDVSIEGSPADLVAVSAEIANSGSPISDVSVVMEVRRDGHLVDEVVVVEFSRITDGAVSFSAAYEPEAPFESGLWTFRLRIEVPGDSGAPVVLAQTGTIAKLDVP